MTAAVRSGEDQVGLSPLPWITHVSAKTLPDGILRGVPLSRLLRHGMLPWRTGPSGLSMRSKRLLWGLSAPVKKIDSFVSHAWSAPGWMKYVQLSLQNGFAHGLAAALVVLLVLVILSGLGLGLPWITANTSHVQVGGWACLAPACQIQLSMWCTLVVPAVGLAVVLLSPCLPRMRSADPAVFLDVACISQTDDALKLAGIDALGSILHRSKELHVMWSPDYFSRLWCVYELAAFLCVSGRCIRFCPLFMEAAILLLAVVNWLAGTLYMLLMVNFIEDSAFCSYLFAYSACLGPQLFCMHVLRCWMRDKQALVSQLEAFDVCNAMCREERDRSHILQSIQRWYGSEPDFNEQVRRGLLQMLAEDRKSTALPYWMAFVCSSGVRLCVALDLMQGMLRAGIPAIDLLYCLALVINVVCFVDPTLTRIFFALAERFAVKCHYRTCDWAVSLAVFLLWTGLSAFMEGGMAVLLLRMTPRFGTLASMLGSFIYCIRSIALMWAFFRRNLLCR